MGAKGLSGGPRGAAAQVKTRRARMTSGGPGVSAGCGEGKVCWAGHARIGQVQVFFFFILFLFLFLFFSFSLYLKSKFVFESNYKFILILNIPIEYSSMGGFYLIIYFILFILV